MNLPGPRQRLLFAASLSAGIAAGWALRQGKAPGPSGPAASALRLSSGEAVAGSKAAEPFTMERFRAASGLPMHRMLAQVLPHADAALVRALAEQLVARPEFPPEAVWNALLARWVQLDAPAALAWARTVEGKDLAQFTITAWAETDLEAALAAAQAGGNNRELLSVHQVLVKTDAARALALFAEQQTHGGPGVWLDNDFLNEVYFNWGLQNPVAAAAHLANLDAKYADAPFWQKLASGWVRKDPEGCRAWLAGLHPPYITHALQGVINSVTENPASVANIVGSLPPTDQTISYSLQIVSQWAEKDAPAALAWVRQHFPDGRQRLEAFASVADAMIKKDVRAAVALMDEMGWDDGERDHIAQTRLLLPGANEPAETTSGTWLRDRDWNPKYVMSSLLARLGRVDPELAVRCYEKTVAAGNPASVESFVPEWFAHQPEAALQWLAAQPADKVQPSDLKQLLNKSLELEPEAARDWALRLPPGPLQQAFAAQSVADGIPGDPAKAAEAIPFTDPATRQAALGEIIREWSMTSPVSALDRMLREPTPMPEACEAVLENWSAHDPTAASTWVNAQPPGPNRDAAIQGLATSLTDYEGQPDYPSAFIWSLSMTDPASRLQTAQSVLEGWGQNGAAAEEMRTVLETTTALPETERHALLKLLNP